MNTGLSGTIEVTEATNSATLIRRASSRCTDAPAFRSLQTSPSLRLLWMSPSSTAAFNTVRSAQTISCRVFLENLALAGLQCHE